MTKKLRFILFLSLFFIVLTIKSTTYYWIGGSGTYGDPLHLATNAAGTATVNPIGFSGIQSTDDLIFNDNSGLGVSNLSYAITLPPSGGSCGNMTFSITITTATASVIYFSGTTRLDIYGNLSVNLPSAVSLTFNNADLRFQLPTNGATNTIVNNSSSNLLFASTTVYFDNSKPGTFNVQGLFQTSSNGNGVVVASDRTIGAATLTVNFNTKAKISAYVAANSTVNFNAGYTKSAYGGNGGRAHSVLNGALETIGASSDANELYPEGIVNMSNIYYTAYRIAGGNYLTSYLDMANSTITLQELEAVPGSNGAGVWSYYNSGATLVTTNSKLIFPNGAGIDGGNHTYNVIDIQEIPSEKYSVNGNISKLLSVDSLLVDAELAVSNNVGINSLFRLAPGHNCYGGVFTTAALTTTTSIAGNCELPNSFHNTNFFFQAGSQTAPYLIADYLILDSSRVLSAIPANAGANSMKVVGTNTTGWIIGSPVARTLFWIGPIPSNVNDSTTYGNWWDKNNWSSNSSASPSNAIGGPQCPPTYMDSVVFPANSYVTCNLARQYCKSMLWQGTGTLYSENVKELEVWGSLELSAAMKNRLNGTVWFKTYETYPTITTRAKPFVGGVVFAATCLTGTVATGEWLLKDKLYVPSYDRRHPYPFNLKLNYDYDGPWYYSIALINGHLKTGIDANTSTSGIQIDPVLSQSQDIECRGFVMEGGAILSLFNSQFIMQDPSYGGHGYKTKSFYINDYNYNFTSSLKCTINAGTSNIIFSYNTTYAPNDIPASYQPGTYGHVGPAAYLGKGHRFYDITFTGANTTGVIELFQDTIRHLNFYGGGYVRQNAYWPGFNSTTTNESGLISRLNFNHPNKLAYIDSKIDWLNTHTNYHITIDSLYFAGNGSFNNIETKIRSILQFTAGYAYTIKNGQNVELAPTLSGSNYPYPYKQAAAQTNSYNFSSGGVLNSIGTCTSNISISGGNFIGSAFTNTVSYNVISNNTFSGSGYNYTHSILSGITTGWSGSPDAGRKLHWKDISGTASHTQSWNDPNSWEEINANGTLKYASPQCPPTRIDTVIFDVNSFSAINQVVQVSLGSSVAECYSMYWGTTPFSLSSSVMTPKFDAPIAQKLSVFGNLQFNSGMTQNFFGPITFRGPYDYNFGGSGSCNFVESAGKSFYEPIVFEADADNKKWELHDAIKTTTTTASATFYSYASGHFNLWRGILDTKGYTLDIGNFNSVSSTYRKLILNNSTINIDYQRFYAINAYSSPDWYVDGPNSSSLFHIDAGTSNINANSVSFYFAGGGHKYNNLTRTISIGALFIGKTPFFGNNLNRDTFNIINNPTLSPLVFGLSGSPSYTPDSLVIHKVISNGDLTIFSNGNTIDSLVMNANGTIYTNNIFNKLLQFASNKTYYLGANTVQWIKNQGKFSPIGTTGNYIQFYSGTSGQPAYVRKDSGYVCADFIHMKDIWAIGNGNNPAACNSGTLSGINTNCSPTPTNSFVVSTCDTITDYLSSCGPMKVGNIPTYTRGRADFNGGPNADYQSNIFGWAKNPYPALPKFTLVSILPNTVCQGDSMLATFTGVGSFPMNITYTSSVGSSVLSYTSSTGLTSYNSSTSAFTYTTYIKPIASGTVSAVYISIERCFNSDTVGTGSFSYTVNPKPEFEKYNRHVLCKGTTSGIAAVTQSVAGTPGYNYNWSGGYPDNDSVSVAAGNYTCYITDARGCKDTVSLSVIEPTLALSLSVSTGTTNCGQSIGVLTTTVSGGWSNSYTYIWQSVSNSTLATTASVSALPAGNYTVMVVDTGNCMISKYTSVNTPVAPFISSSATNSVNCFGQATGSLSVIVTPGASPTYSISWAAPATYTGAIVSFSNSSISNLSMGNYTVTILDANNCSASQIYAINQPTSPITSTIAAISHVNCFGNTTGSASINASAGTGAITYSWVPNGGNTASASSLAAGNYTVDIADANNCSFTQTLSIIQPSTALTIASATQTDVLCNGQSNAIATASVTGGTIGYSYTWLPISVLSTTNTASSLSAGNYTLSVTDANSCVVTQTFVINEPNSLVAVISNTTQANCGVANGSASITVTGGTAVFTYSWTTPSTTYTTSAATTNSLSAGNNNVTVTDVNGCTTQTNVTITNPNAPSIAITFTNVLCYNMASATASANVVGGTPAYTYSWSNGGTTPVISNVIAGSYTLTVIDASLCKATQTLSITQPTSAVNLVSSVTGNIACFGQSTGAVTTTVTGGTPAYTYTWQPGGFVTSSLSNVVGGIYTVTVRDNNGCTQTNTVIIASPTSSLTISLTNSVQSICEQSNGSINIDVSGGTLSYNYLWNTGSQNQNLTNVAAGSYTLIVTDNNGCKDTLALVLDCKLDLFIPELFSPNGDSRNDKFEIKAIANYPNNTISIFNRWGSLVYSKHKYNNEWDGKANVTDAVGKSLLPCGTYYVILDFGDGETETYHGYVQLEY